MDKNTRPIYEARIKQGLCLMDAAALAGIAPSTLSQIESGSRNLSLEYAHRIAAAIGADPHAVDPRLAPGPPEKCLTLLMTCGGNLIGETPADDQLVAELLPPRPGDVVDRKGPGPASSHLELLVTRAAVAQIRLLFRTDLPPVAE